MFSFHVLMTVARYEIKTLLRSWFFRIFSVLALIIMVLLNVGFFALPYSRWLWRAIPSSIPYMNLLLLNVVQAVIGVFVSADFLKYDNRLDTTEVIYMRSMTNTEYVFRVACPDRPSIRINAAEHVRYRWLSRREALACAGSRTNRDAIARFVPD